MNSWPYPNKCLCYERATFSFSVNSGSTRSIPKSILNPENTSFCSFFFFSFISDIAMDWSDHAMWWPDRNIWLDKTRWTLDQYNITADALIYFTPMHKTLRIQLPDLRFIDCRVDFSVKTFNSSLQLCQELGKAKEKLHTRTRESNT